MMASSLRTRFYLKLSIMLKRLAEIFIFGVFFQTVVYTAISSTFTDCLRCARRMVLQMFMFMHSLMDVILHQHLVRTSLQHFSLRWMRLVLDRLHLSLVVIMLWTVITTGTVLRRLTIPQLRARAFLQHQFLMLCRLAMMKALLMSSFFQQLLQMQQEIHFHLLRMVIRLYSLTSVQTVLVKSLEHSAMISSQALIENSLIFIMHASRIMMRQFLISTLHLKRNLSQIHLVSSQLTMVRNS